MDNVTNQLCISQIDIENLFGIYSYSIPFDSMDISKLLILYGENGAGKTTILQMIFNLLSSEYKKNRKTNLANTIFKKISITLSNSYIITASRSKGLEGDYLLEIKTDSDKLSANCYTTLKDELYKVNFEHKADKEKLLTFLDAIKRLNLSIHYLADSREVKNSNMNISNFPIDMLSNGKKPFSDSDTYLMMAISSLEHWFKDQIAYGNAKGEKDISNILIKSITEPETKTLSKQEVLAKIEQSTRRNNEFTRYNLSPDYELSLYQKYIQEGSEDSLNKVDSRIENIKTKLDAIEDTKNIIHSFVTILNDFYSAKELSYSIDDGISINSVYNNKEKLDPTILSSGEKQLLLLFCNTITAREQASIFIIDEPELSLNVKWQRKLIDALLSFSEGSSIQFILASHSIELLTRYDENVCALENIKEF